MRTTTVTDTTCPNCGTFTPKDTEPHWDSSDCIAALRAELATLQAAQQWRPASLSPADDGRYLTHNGREFDIHAWDGRWHDSCYGRYPTYWRPLPPAPNEADEVQP